MFGWKCPFLLVRFIEKLFSIYLLHYCKVVTCDALCWLVSSFGAHSHLAQLSHTMPKYQRPPFPLPRCPAFTLLQSDRAWARLSYLICGVRPVFLTCIYYFKMYLLFMILHAVTTNLIAFIEHWLVKVLVTFTQIFLLSHFIIALRYCEFNFNLIKIFDAVLCYKRVTALDMQIYALGLDVCGRLQYFYWRVCTLFCDLFYFST